MSLAASVRVDDPQRSPFGIHGGNPAQTPTGFTQLIRDGFPMFHAAILSFHLACGNYK